MRKVVVTACLFVAMASFAASANDVIDIQSTPAQIRAVQDGIKQSMERKEGAYKDLGAAERQAIVDQQQVISRILEGKDSIAMLDEPQKVEIANALESVNALVTQAEDNRKVCERVKVIGSNRPQSVCMTVAQRRRLREDVQRNGIKAAN